MYRMLRCSVFTYLLLSLLLVLNVYAQDPAPVHTAVTPDGTVRKGVNRVLSLDGDEDYVEMADSGILGNVGSQVTVEAWIKPTEFAASWINIALKTDESGPPDWRYRSYVLQLTSQGSIHLSSSPSGRGQIFFTSQRGSIVPNIWYHVAVVVQAVSHGKVIATTLSDEQGKYQFINLKPGRYQVRCYTLDGYVYYSEGEDKPVEMSDATFLQVEGGKTIRDIDLRFPPFKKGVWRNYTYSDGLGGNFVFDIHCEPDGIMWFAAGTSDGISQFDGEFFTNLSPEDGLVDSDVTRIHRDRHGALWFGTGLGLSGGGVSRYKDGEFHNFSTKDGLPSKEVLAIESDPDGVMWFGTMSGASRYDGKEFRNFTTEDGLGYDIVLDIHCDPDGVMWFATAMGLSRYDGQEFANFITADGLPGYTIRDIHRDPSGAMWLGTGWGDAVPGTGSGVSRYDGSRFVNFSTQDGLLSNNASRIYSDANGVMWLGTDLGVSRYDGEGFVNYTAADGLVCNQGVEAIYRADDGALWFASGGGWYNA